jgi:hypothetical protein
VHDLDGDSCRRHTGTMSNIDKQRIAAVRKLEAKYERQAVSRRTKEALQAAKTRGVKLGNPNGADALRWLGNRLAVEALKRASNTRARDVLPIIEDIRASGIAGLNGIAAELNRRGILTARGGRWWPTTIRNLLARAPS